MGMMSNRWLNRGQGLRSRSYHPVRVEINAINPTNAWSKQHEIAVEVTATQPNSELQKLHLTAVEAEKAANTILNACSENAKAQIVGQLLEKLSDSEFHRVLADAHKKRVEKA
jgi:hypothetical protein